MASRKKRSFTPAFKADAVKLCRGGDQSIRQVAKNLDLTDTVLLAWVKRAEIDAGRGPRRTSRAARWTNWRAFVGTTSGCLWNATS